jgi:hypothetical protein
MPPLLDRLEPLDERDGLEPIERDELDTEGRLMLLDEERLEMLGMLERSMLIDEERLEMLGWPIRLEMLG